MQFVVGLLGCIEWRDWNRAAVYYWFVRNLKVEWEMSVAISCFETGCALYQRDSYWVYKLHCATMCLPDFALPWSGNQLWLNLRNVYWYGTLDQIIYKITLGLVCTRLKKSYFLFVLPYLSLITQEEIPML